MKKTNNKMVLGWIYQRCKRFIPLVSAISLLAATVSVLVVGLSVISKSVLDIATGDKSGSFWTYGIILMILVILQILCSAIESYLKSMVTGKLIVSIRNYMFSVVETRKFSKISNFHSGDLLNRITNDVDVIQTSIVNIIPNTVSMITKIIGCVSALIMLDTKIALIILSVGILLPAFGRVLSRRYKHLHKEVQSTEGNTRSFMQECFENLSVMKTFKTKTMVKKRLMDYLLCNYRIKLKRSIISILMHVGLSSLFTLGYYAILLWGAIQIANPDVAFTFGTLTAFLQLVLQVRTPLQNVSALIPQYYSCIASAERLMEIENLDAEKAAVESESLQKLYDDFQYISGENICFGYEDNQILKDFSFRIDRGSMTAILGDSGTGKSTLFKLLLSLYEADSGKLTVNGETDINASVRGLFSYVPQGNMIISGSIKENVKIANPAASDEAIINACKIAEIYDYIETLPKGLDTELSEHGLGLSEGQLQRIAIARAIVADTPVLLLDEATSALDKPTEAKVLKNIKNLSNKTVISVTHRTSNLNLCDNIINLTEK